LETRLISYDARLFFLISSLGCRSSVSDTINPFKIREMRNSFCLCFLLILATACAKKNPYHAVNKEDALAFARSLEACAMGKAGDFDAQVIDETLFKERVAEKMIWPTSSLDMQLIPSMKDVRELMSQIRRQVGKTGHYKLLRVYTKDSMQHALFRMVHSGGGVNYHDFLLARRERKVRAADVYVYLSGEELSETMAGFMKMVVSRDGKVNQHKRYYFQLLEELRKKSESADYATALQTFDALPDALKTSKTSLMYGMISAKSLGYAEREEEMMVQYRMNHHTVPDRMLLGIDYYYDRGQLDSSLLMINGLDSLLQKDDYMQYLRAALYAQTDRVDESMELLEELVRIKDCMAPPVIMLAWLKANTGDLAGAAKLHRRYRRMPDADADEARRLTDEYPDLLKSKRAEGAQQ